MPIPAINTRAKVDPTNIPLEKLATSKALTQEQKTAEMTRQFEAVLLRQILTEAHKPVFASKFAVSGVSSAIYQDMMVNNLADKISSSRTVGLAQELENQVSRQNGPGKKTPAAALTPTNQSQSQVHKQQEPPLPLTKAPRL